ncbi:MAG: hypothetical protein JWO30_2950 [Fibrobacteres bacterium]|nr:hypothetical protein [Fibrobacterota bacterium]
MSNGNVEKAILAEMGKPQSGLIDRVTRHNQILPHNYKKAVERSCECQLMGCAHTFSITLVPNQVLYPKYCEAHRSEYRRENFLRQFAGQTAVYRVETFRVLAEPVSFPSTPE